MATTRELQNSIKAFNFLDNIRCEQYVDAKDEGRWKVGQIVGIKSYTLKPTLTIHFDGYPARWNQDYELPTQKLAPFRMFTAPFTGTTSSYYTYRESPKPEPYLKQLSSPPNFDSLTASHINQYYRGELFIVIDNILTDHSSLSSDQHARSTQLLKLYIQTGFTFLNFARTHIKQQISNEAIHDPHAMCVSTKYAALHALTEILFNFNSMISMQNNRVEFHKNHRMKVPVAEAIQALKKIMTDNHIVDHCNWIIDFVNLPNRSYPWPVKREALSLLKALDVPHQFPDFTEAREIMEVLDSWDELKRRGTFDYDFLQEKQIKLMANLIIYGNFQAKLKGLNQLKRSLDSRSFYRKPKSLQNLVENQLLPFLISNKNFSGELFKRSIPIFEYAQKEKILTEKHLTSIISLHKDKHEQQIKAYYAGLKQFGRFLSREKVLWFFQQILVFPLEENYINLQKQFTKTIIQKHDYYKRAYMENNEGFGVIYFWNLIESNPKQIGRELREKIIEAFSQLLSDIYYKKQMEKFIIQAFQNIKKRINVESSLKIIQYTLKNSRSFSMETIINRLEKDLNIIDEVIEAVLQNKDISDEAIGSLFLFLKQVNRYAKKGLTIEHICNLWKLQPCRQSLLQFIRKPSSNRSNSSVDKILYKQLNSSKILELLRKIFLSPTQMNHYKKISPNLYQTVDELIIAYNYYNRSIEYNTKHSIRSLKTHDMVGLEFYLDVATGCDNNEIVKKSLRRFIQFYLRPQQKSYFYSEISIKVQSWKVCFERLSKLEEKSFRAYQIMLEQVEGRMKSLCIFEPYPITFNVLLKGSNSQKATFSLPRYTSLWRLRQIINEQFSLQYTNFQLYLPQNRISLDMIKQEDFSLAMIEIPIDTENPAVVVTPSREIHPHYDAIENFKEYISNSEGLKLYESLSMVSPQAESLLFSILNNLPAIKNLEKKIQKLQISHNWEEILDSQCRKKLAYQLKLIRKIKSQQWCLSFIRKKGIQQISKILLSRGRGRTTSNEYQILTELLQILIEVVKYAISMKEGIPFQEKFIYQLIKIQHQSSTLAHVEYFMTVFGLIKELTQSHSLYLQKLFEHSSFTYVFEFLFFTTHKTQKASKFYENIRDITENLKSLDSLTYIIGLFIHYEYLKKCQNKCRIFFELLVQMFDYNFVNDFLFQKVIKFGATIREKSQDMEDDQDNPNELLSGWLALMNCLILKNITTDNQLPIMTEPENKFVEYLIKDCLLGKNPKLKSIKCRENAFNIVMNISSQKDVAMTMSRTMTPLAIEGSSVWRLKKDWNVALDEKRKGGFVGIKNLGATCYINSLLQQLYFTQKFTQPFLQLNLKNLKNQKQNVGFEIQKIFTFLTYLTKPSTTTQSLCQLLTFQGQPINPSIQMDVDEFFHSLMDKLQNNLSKLNKKSLIDNVFRGEYSNLIVGQCQHKSEQIEQFLSMRLQILQKKSLFEALTELVKVEVLEGDNSYFCQRCDKKVKAQKRVCVKSLPEILILTLKRFQFNFDTMQRYKVNSFCEFPIELDMQPYLRETLFLEDDVVNEKHETYRLKGILTHAGMSEAGHYTSYIRTSENTWHYFDDQRITDFDIKDLQNECFGGVQEGPYGNEEEKMKNAYILFYQKVSEMKQRCSSKDMIDHNLVEEVRAENTKNQLARILFQNRLIDYMGFLSKNIPKDYLIYVHLVLLHSYHRPLFIRKAYQACQGVLLQSLENRAWYLQQFTPNIIKEFLFNAPAEVKFFVGGLLIICVQKVYVQEFALIITRYISRKSICPINKVIQEMAKYQKYNKFFRETSIGNKIWGVVRMDQDSEIQQQILKSLSEFSEIQQEIIPKKDNRDKFEFMYAVQNLKIQILNHGDIEFLSKNTEKKKIQIPLAKVISLHFCQKDNLNQLINNFLGPRLTKFDPKNDQQYEFNFAILILAYLCDVSDEITNSRVRKLAELYIQALSCSTEGYQTMRILLERMFTICTRNSLFKQEICELLPKTQDFQRLIKSIQSWIKNGDRFYQLVKEDKLGYWRKPHRIHYATYGQLKKIEADKKINIELYLQLFFAIVEGNKMEGWSRSWFEQPEINDDILVETFTGSATYKVVSKLGLLYEVKVNGATKYVYTDDILNVIKK